MKQVASNANLFFWAETQGHGPTVWSCDRQRLACVGLLGPACAVSAVGKAVRMVICHVCDETALSDGSSSSFLASGEGMPLCGLSAGPLLG